MRGFLPTCGRCGDVNDQGAIFCAGCGSRLVESLTAEQRAGLKAAIDAARRERENRPRVAACLWCGASLEGMPTRGAPRKFCCDAHRKYHHRKHYESPAARERREKAARESRRARRAAMTPEQRRIESLRAQLHQQRQRAEMWRNRATGRRAA